MKEKFITYLEDLAETIDHWAIESNVGGWSTHQVRANKLIARNIREKIQEITVNIIKEKEKRPLTAQQVSLLTDIFLTYEKTKRNNLQNVCELLNLIISQLG